MYSLFIGIFISLKIEKLLILYFNNISFYCDFIFFSNKNLFYITFIDTILGWYSYEQMFVNDFLIMQTIELLFLSESFVNDYIFLFENIKLKNQYECWQLLIKIYKTHGKRFMLFKSYRNNNIINVLIVCLASFILIFSILIIEIVVMVVLFYCLYYLVKVEFNKKLTIKFIEYKNYLKGLFSVRLLLQQFQYINKNYLFLSCFFIFNYFNNYSFFDLFIFFALLYSTAIFFFYYCYKFLILYNFYFVLICIFTINKILKRIRLILKILIIKFNLYFSIVLLQLIYLINTEISFELIANNNFYQELLLKIFLIYWILLKSIYVLF